MVEYTVILAFGVAVLMGPGDDVLLDLATVLNNKYRGYSYAMSMSTLPDFGSGQELRVYIADLNLDPKLDEVTIDRLAVDPVGDAVSSGLESFASAYSSFNDVKDLLGELESVDDLAAQMLEDALSPF